MTVSSPTLFIRDFSALQFFCDSLRGAKWIAIDTEFLREKTYYPKFCLLQIADGRQTACIDPLAIDNLQPLEEILFDPATVKVVHAGRQDLEIFHMLWHKLPSPIFDTQIAAPLIGTQEQLSYAALVAEMLGVNLSKGHTRTDWSARPLSEAQLRYAADDVIYLGAAYEALRGKLEALGRLEWLSEDFAALSNPELYETRPEQAWLRISGTHSLRPPALAALQILAAWRETVAQELDIPRNWVLKDEIILDISRLLPKSIDDLKQIRGIEERTLKRYGTKLLSAIAESEGRPPILSELKARPAKKNSDREAVLDLLGAVVRLQAARHSINPSTLGTRKDLEQLLDEPESARLLKGWRKTMAGEELEAIIAGQCRIAVRDGRMHVKREP